MRVAVVVYAYYSRDARVRRYAELLASQGHIVDCISFAEDYQPRNKNISVIGFPLERRRWGVVWYLVEYSLFFLFTGWVLFTRSLDRDKRYSLIHINNMPEVLVFAAWVPKLYGARLLLDIHDPTPELFMSKYHKQPGSQSVRLLRYLEKASLRFADRIVTANEMFRKLLLRRSPGLPKNKIGVILNCPDPNVFRGRTRVKKTDHQFNIYYMGTVEERLALDVMLESLPQIVKAVPAVKFVLIPKLAAEGSYYRRLCRRIEASGLSGHVEIKPPLPLEQIAILLRQADVGIVLSKKDSYTDIIFPLKLLEFIQMGIPVVAVKTKLLGSHFSDQEILFLKKADKQELAKSVIGLYRDPALRQRYADRAKTYLEKHNWQAEKGKYLSFVHELTDKPIKQ